MARLPVDAVDSRSGMIAETLHPASSRLHEDSDEAILNAMLDSHRSSADAVSKALPAIAQGARLMADSVSGGHRLIYVGAGSAGLMALADSLELPVTFGIDSRQVSVLFPGGAAQLVEMTGAPEDDPRNGTSDMERLAPVPGDVVICVSASGSTPYTEAIAGCARDAGATVVGIANVPGAPVLTGADVPILLDTGPEIVAGSTRLSAGTAQKIALNMLSTLMGIRLGHVHAGRMVNMVADNAKLRLRAERIVQELSGVDEICARDAVKKSGGSIKTAVLMAKAKMAREEAEARLAAHAGHLGNALAGM